MTTDVGQEAARLWAAYGGWIIAGAVAVTLALVTLALIAWWRAADRAQALSRVTAVVVLAWTSEGLWEVATQALALPVGFAAVTFFVFEAMMLAAGMRAERHRARYGTAGPTGRYVWVIASVTATVVALNSDSLVELVLRVAIPLTAVGLWWTISISSPRDTDTAEILAAREAARQARETTWTITPSTVLVWLGLRRPGKQTLSEAEQERLRRRMVVAADRLAAARAGSVAYRRHAARLRRLARQATPEDVAWVRAQVAMTTRIVDLVVPSGNSSLPVLPQMPAPRAAAPAPANPTPAVSVRADREPAGNTEPAGRRHTAGNAGTTPAPEPAAKPAPRRQPAGDPDELITRIAALLAQEPDLSAAQIAARFPGVSGSERTWRNRARQARELLAAGNVPATAGDGAATSVAAPTAAETASPNGHTTVPPAEVAALAAAAAGTAGGGAA